MGTQFHQNKENKGRQRGKNIPEMRFTLSRSQLQAVCTAFQDRQSQKIHHVPGAHVSVSNLFPSKPEKNSTIRLLQSCSQSHGLPTEIVGGRESRGKQTLFCLLVQHVTGDPAGARRGEVDEGFRIPVIPTFCTYLWSAEEKVH